MAGRHLVTLHYLQNQVRIIGGDIQAPWGLIFNANIYLGGCKAVEWLLHHKHEDTKAAPSCCWDWPNLSQLLDPPVFIPEKTLAAGDLE